jgi:transposase-like protein
MARQRRHFTPEQKVALLRLHLLEKKPVSDICEAHNLGVNLSYLWQKQFFENGAAAFEDTARRRKAAADAKDRRIAALEDKLRRKNEVLSELMEEHVQLKKSAWGALKGVWVPHDTRDSIVDFVNRWSEKTGIAVQSFLLWIGIATSKWHSWKGRYGKANEHNALLPRDHWLEAQEKQAILNFHDRRPRRATAA